MIASISEYSSKNSYDYLLSDIYTYNYIMNEMSSSGKAYIFPSWHGYKKTNFQFALMFLKLVQFSSKIFIVSNKIRFKAIHHLQYRENVHFLLPPFNWVPFRPDF